MQRLAVAVEARNEQQSDDLARTLLERWADLGEAVAQAEQPAPEPEPKAEPPL